MGGRVLEEKLSVIRMAERGVTACFYRAQRITVAGISGTRLLLGQGTA